MNSNCKRRRSFGMPALPLALGAAIGLGACVNDGRDLATSASTAGTTAYLIHEDREDDDFARARDFADKRSVALRRDVAAGEGEHLDAFATLMGASDTDAFGRWLQGNYASLYGSAVAEGDLVTRVVALRGSR
ncbi:DUF3015 family protein [Salinisphaera sp. P385]|uniref:DUF3015 family protein n=1 Tax=Spectribacter acetivorans TaxID=3075603 RepID=A0ABU3B630_9GAMM|nr:DUF3015 family protein [Salinisphaera sp. P385]MDT0617914.1 DUF3015 family protein [Salinisphaera sp. P385]